MSQMLQKKYHVITPSDKRFQNAASWSLETSATHVLNKRFGSHIKMKSVFNAMSASEMATGL